VETMGAPWGARVSVDILKKTKILVAFEKYEQTTSGCEMDAITLHTGAHAPRGGALMSFPLAPPTGQSFQFDSTFT